MSGVWKTKYGMRRVRHDPPTLAEAVAAARGLTDDMEQQIEIAAALMDLPIERVRGEVLKAASSRKDINTVAFVGRSGAPRTVVVERVPSRRLTAGRDPAGKSVGAKSIGSNGIGAKALGTKGLGTKGRGAASIGAAGLSANSITSSGLSDHELGGAGGTGKRIGP